MRERVRETNDPHWYRDAVIYQTHVRAFRDSNSDGIGDFRGLTSKLDYLQDLGITAIWVMPFYPSPLRDDGYDIADYEGVHPSYGTLRDVREFVREAHRRGLHVITEMVTNHTSDQHPWFQRARRAKPGSAARDFYVWSDTADKYTDARIIFRDFEPSNWSWDSVANAYYWHRFYSHQPDLNFDNPRVHDALLKSVDFWMDMGVDGMRLDAIPYLYEREGTSCENLPETHAFLKKLRAHVDANYSNRMLLAEANQWPEDAVEYFGEGDECHMCFHFPVMPRLYMAVRMEDRTPIVDILEQTPAIPDGTQWAMFLRNHDELTLEMVTDEERDYMYRSYAQDPNARINLGIRRRLAPLLGNNRRRIELMNGLLFALPGTPIVYYGDEIGMGDNIFLGDRNGVRTPMQWSGDRNAGFSEANRQQLYFPVIVDPEYHYETVNVETQQSNSQSLLWWTKRLIALRKRYRAFGRGDITFLQPENRKVLAFVRRFEDERILMVANLSRFSQAVELDLSEWRGMSPVELFGNSEFPSIGELPYFVTLGPHSFYWFSLESPRVIGEQVQNGDGIDALPEMVIRGAWTAIFDVARPQLEKALRMFLVQRRWYQGARRTIQGVELIDVIPLEDGGPQLAILQVAYTEGDAESYLMPLAFAQDDDATRRLHDHPHAVVARVNTSHGSGVLFDALWDPALARDLLELIVRRRRLRGEHGTISTTARRPLRTMASKGDTEWPEPTNLRVEQRNSSVIFGDSLILKTFRRLQAGIQPDLEVGTALADSGSYQHTAEVLGSVEYQSPAFGRETVTVALLHAYVLHDSDAWDYTLDQLDSYLERALTTQSPFDQRDVRPASLLALAAEETPDDAQRMIRSYLEDARLLGQRTGEMHLALASLPGKDFEPEPWVPMTQRSTFQSMRNLTVRALEKLKSSLPNVQDEQLGEAATLISRQAELLDRFSRISGARLGAARTRIHGDYRLGQVLLTGRDFVTIDFEGDPARTLSDRRGKRSPFRDVADMLFSFAQAGRTALHEQRASGINFPDDQMAEGWLRGWYAWVGAAYLRGWLAVVDGAPFTPEDPAMRALLLDVMFLSEALSHVQESAGIDEERAQDAVRIVLDALGPEPPPMKNTTD